MKVIKTNATSNELSSEIDLFEGVKLPRREKVRIAEEAKEILEAEILKSVGNAKSPIAGESWPALSPEYKKFKQSRNRPGKANMEFSGDSLDTLGGEVTGSGRLKMGYFGDRAEIMESHNHLSGEGSNPKRRSLPGADQKFKRGIQNQLDELVRDAVAQTTRLPVRRLQRVETKTEFFSIMSEVFGTTSRLAITDAIIGNDEMLDQVTKLGLLGFLSGS